MKRKHSSETGGEQRVKQKYKSNVKKRCGKRAEWEDRTGKMKGVGEKRWGVGRRGAQGEKMCVCARACMLEPLVKVRFWLLSGCSFMSVGTNGSSRSWQCKIPVAHSRPHTHRSTRWEERPRPVLIHVHISHGGLWQSKHSECTCATASDFNNDTSKWWNVGEYAAWDVALCCTSAMNRNTSELAGVRIIIII